MHVNAKRRDARGKHLRWPLANLPMPQKRAPTTLFDKLAQWLYPTSTEPQLATLFPERAAATLRDWRIGRCNAPEWAIERLRIKVHERLEILQRANAWEHEQARTKKEAGD
jgi:hypothetical protein